MRLSSLCARHPQTRWISCKGAQHEFPEQVQTSEVQALRATPQTRFATCRCYPRPRWAALQKVDEHSPATERDLDLRPRRVEE